MPALQRTPPQKAGQSPAKPYDRPVESPAARATPDRSASPARTPKRATPGRPSGSGAAKPTTPRAFLPRAQKVLRTPPEGSGTPAMPPPPLPIQTTAPSIDPLSAAAVPAEVLADTDMFVEEQIAAGTSTAPRKSIYPSLPPSAPTQLAAPTEPISTTPIASPQPRKSTTPLHPPPPIIAAVPVPSPAAPATPSPPPAAATAPVPRPVPSAAPALRPATAAAPQSEAGPSSASAAPALPVPAPRTPRHRRQAAEALDEAIPTIEVDEEEQWGKRYDATINALKIAIDSAASKWTPRELKAIFPLLAAKFPQELNQICADAAASMKSTIKTEAKAHFEQHRVGRALQMLDAVVKDGQDYAARSSDARPDAWRPDLSPEALTAAANMGIYDESYERLRTEYLELHKRCASRYTSIQAKKAQLVELETSISDSVKELDETLQTLDGFPTGDMKDWAETTMGRMEGGRVVEKA